MITPKDILQQLKNEECATQHGTAVHAKLQRVVIDGDTVCGDADLVSKIIAHPDLVRFFAPNTRPEVPVAGFVNGKFVSRRLDRLCVDDVARIVEVLDYKTDVDTHKRHAEYVCQVREYMTLMHKVYPGYSVKGYILWTHNFLLEEIN